MSDPTIPRQRARGCVIGPYHFPTKKAATEQIREILHSSDLESPLTGDALRLIRALLDLHHEADTKIGPGVRSIEVRIIEFGARGFWVTRTDGTMVDFSYRTALNGAPTPKANAQAALRWEIEDQVNEVREAAFSAFNVGLPECPLTGQPLTRATAHIDHDDPTFAEMAETFANAVGGWSTLEVECVGDTGCRRQLADRGLAEAWRQYHGTVARLRVVHRDANLARRRASGGVSA